MQKGDGKLAKEKRFLKVFEQTSMMENMRVIVDTQTGVQYLCFVNGYAGGITPLLNRDGKPVISTVSSIDAGPEL